LTDKEFKEQKLRLKKFLDKWQKPAGFGWFTLEVQFDRERDEEAPGTFGKCWSRWQYRTGTIRFYLPIVKELSDSDLELNVLHELCHLLVSPLQDFSTPEKSEITEYTTTCVAEALYWAHTQVKKGLSNGQQTKKAPDKAEESHE
jgi:hypothetical protein